MVRRAAPSSLRLALRLLVAGVLLGLAGCDLLGLESASDIAARKEAEGKAIGGACRHAARSIEECYEQNKRADKAAVFAGWREMNDYMRENKIEAVAPTISGARKSESAEASDAEEASDESAKPAKKKAS